jgi:hypothetical protein
MNRGRVFTSFRFNELRSWRSRRREARENPETFPRRPPPEPLERYVFGHEISVREPPTCVLIVAAGASDQICAVDKPGAAGVVRGLVWSRLLEADIGGDAPLLVISPGSSE